MTTPKPPQAALQLVPFFHGANPFEQHPQLKTIWPAASQALAEEATMEALDAVGPNVHCGIYLAKLGEEVVGMTGFMVTLDGPEPFLRWHGVVPKHRGQGLSAQVLALVKTEIARHLPKAKTLTELIPRAENYADLSRHFEKLGFVKTGPVERYSWSNYAWQPWQLTL